MGSLARGDWEKEMWGSSLGAGVPGRAAFTYLPYESHLPTGRYPTLPKSCTTWGTVMEGASWMGRMAVVCTLAWGCGHGCSLSPDIASGQLSCWLHALGLGMNGPAFRFDREIDPGSHTSLTFLGTRKEKRIGASFRWKTWSRVQSVHIILSDKTD